MSEGSSSLAFINSLLRPRSIAILGASSNPNKMAGLILPAIKKGGYTGRLIAINPQHSEIDGVKCYPDLASVDGEIDHCIVLLPQALVAKALDDCVEFGVKGASVFA